MGAEMPMFSTRMAQMTRIDADKGAAIGFDPRSSAFIRRIRVNAFDR
jgi:hypothetical protein